MPCYLYWFLITMLPLTFSYDEKRIEEPAIGPHGMSYNKTTSCKEFGKNARFNPHAVVGSRWFVFYYWATPRPPVTYKFYIPTKAEMVLLHELLDGHTPPHFNWSHTLVLMDNMAENTTSLLEERGDRGQYWRYPLRRDYPKGYIVKATGIRFKQTSDNKYIGLVICKTHVAMIMSRISDVPPKNKIQDEAARLGYRGRRGKSYLYQGHEWMPIPEMNERDYWRPDKFKRRFNIFH